MTTTTTASARTAGKDAFLRFALRLDAVLTGIMGIGVVALAPRIAELSGTTSTVEYSVGVFFIVYGLVVYALSRMKSVRRPGIAAVGGNVVYALAVLAIVLAGVWPLTTLGVVATLGSGVYTLVMADLQYLGLRRLK